MKRFGLTLALFLATGSTALAVSQTVTLYDKNSKVIELANPLPVTIGTPGSGANVPTPVYTNVAGAASDTPLLAANTSRKPGTAIVNDSTATMYIKLAASGSSSSSYYVALAPATTAPGVFILPDNYSGAVCATWSAANGFARVTEMQ